MKLELEQFHLNVKIFKKILKLLKKNLKLLKIYNFFMLIKLIYIKAIFNALSCIS
jgi:hypothetical protein